MLTLITLLPQLGLLHGGLAAEDVPWPGAAIAKALHYIPVYNPSIEHNYCGIDFGQFNFVDLFHGKVGANFASVEQQCKQHGVDIKMLKVRLGAVDEPEKGYDQASVECLHLFRLGGGPRDVTGPARVGSRYGPPLFPQAFYLNNRHPLGDASVCISEYISGIPLARHVSSLKTDAEVADFALAMIDLTATLAAHHVVHRDIHPNNLVLQQSVDTSGNSIYRIVLIDFTWAVSPGIVQFERPPSYFNLIYGAPLTPSDSYSIGFVIHDVLSMYCDLDTTWLSPVIEIMMTPQDRFDSIFTFDFDALKHKVSMLLDNWITANEQTKTASNEMNALEKRRYDLCNKPNTFAPPPRIEKGYVVAESEHFPGASLQGYQHFTIFRTAAGGIELSPLSEGLRKKDDILSPLLRNTMNGLSLIDVGGNFGYFCAKSMSYGGRSAVLVDMDTSYTVIAKDMYSYIGGPLSKITVENKRLRDLQQENAPYSADVVIALALIHWSYNCSETRGSLAKTIGSLALRANKMLIIEWIDPMDMAILNENHLGENTRRGEMSEDDISPEDAATEITNTSLVSLTHSPYTFTEFRRVMRRTFDCVREIGQVSPTRRIFAGITGKGRNSYDDSSLGSGRHDSIQDWFITQYGCFL